MGNIMENEKHMATIEQVKIVETRLDKKIVIINEQGDEIHDLEIRINTLETMMRMIHEGGY